MDARVVEKHGYRGRPFGQLSALKKTSIFFIIGTVRLLVCIIFTVCIRVCMCDIVSILCFIMYLIYVIMYVSQLVILSLMIKRTDWSTFTMYWGTTLTLLVMYPGF